METVHKAGHQSESDPLTFVLSDETVDRMGDVIRSDGWDTRQFKNNPIALFGHDHASVIGVWENVRVEGKRLLGTLRLAKKGTSDLVDTVSSLIDQRILKAVSVGFQPIEATPRKSGGMDFIRSALHEVSIVAVPANPSAVALAKAFSPDIVDKLFVKPDATAADNGTGRVTDTPNLNTARERIKSLGIQL